MINVLNAAVLLRLKCFTKANVLLLLMLAFRVHVLDPKTHLSGFAMAK